MQILKTSSLKVSSEFAVWNMFSSVSSTFGVKGAGFMTQGLPFIVESVAFGFEGQWFKVQY